MKDNIVICGDSFHIGIGCDDLANEPYGSLLSKKFNKKLINLAKGSSTNLSIYLQVKYAIENIKDIDFMCVGVTSCERTEWFSEKSKNSNGYLTNQKINYHDYAPYKENAYHRVIDHPMKNDKNYTGEILTENYIGVIDFINKNKENVQKDIFRSGESFEKIKLLNDYYFNFYDVQIQREYDIAIIIKIHLLLKNNKINHYILSSDINDFLPFIPEENLICVSWYDLSNKYPDEFNTLHTSFEGQRVVFETIMNKIEHE